MFYESRSYYASLFSQSEWNERVIRWRSAKLLTDIEDILNFPSINKPSPVTGLLIETNYRHFFFHIACITALKNEIKHAEDVCKQNLKIYVALVKKVLAVSQ
jgi:hypothetical protein